MYYEPVEPDAEELELMRRIDELHLEFPFYGSRSIVRELGKKGCRVNRKRVQRLMRLMGLESVAPKPNTSRPNVEHPVYPYLLRGVKIERPNSEGWGPLQTAWTRAPLRSLSPVFGRDQAERALDLDRQG